jgi:hypothetical protein
MAVGIAVAVGITAPEPVRARASRPGSAPPPDTAERGDDRLDGVGGLLVGHDRSIYVT